MGKQDIVVLLQSGAPLNSASILPPLGSAGKERKGSGNNSGSGSRAGSGSGSAGKRRGSGTGSAGKRALGPIAAPNGSSPLITSEGAAQPQQPSSATARSASATAAAPPLAPAPASATAGGTTGAALGADLGAVAPSGRPRSGRSARSRRSGGSARSGHRKGGLAPKSGRYETLSHRHLGHSRT